MNFRKPQYNAAGGIDCEVEHPTYGWIPFTASPTDPEAHGRDIFDKAKLEAAPYVPPSEDTVRDEWREYHSISRLEFCIACLTAGILTAEDSITAAKGDWPAGFDAAVSDLTEQERTILKIEWAALSQVGRNNPGIIRVVSSKGLSPEQIDALFGWSGEA